ncbi:hypothetical protein BDW66DRAFT_155364 [Aspergillus desertorum]
METTDSPSEENAVHTISEYANDAPHLILTTRGDQLDYIRQLEVRLAELEKTVEALVVGKAELGNDEHAIEAGSTVPSLSGAEGVNTNAGGSGSTKTEEQEVESNELKEEEKQATAALPVVPKAHKLNYANFVNRFFIQTGVPVVEALMVNTTVKAAIEEDLDPIAMVPVSEETLRVILESNSYKPDAWMARIRINSVPMVKVIMEILDPDTSFDTSLTFIHPFDPLVDHHDKFTARLQEMQTALRTQQDETETADEATSEEKAEAAELVSLMEVFVRFIDEEVMPLFHKTRTKVRLASLSSIFKLGDTIYMPDADKGSKPEPEALMDRREQRLGRLYRAKRDLGEDTGNFRLKVYAMDYDGENYVCQQKTIEIPACDGEQEISSLPAFPLRYAENAEQIRHNARVQGRKFVEYQNGLLTHNGWALDPEAGDKVPLRYVTNDVVVDMTKAISTHSAWIQSWKFPKYTPYEHSTDGYSFWHWRIKEGEYDLSSMRMKYWLNEYSRLQKMAYCTKTDSFLSNWYNDHDNKYQPQDEDFELLPRRLFAYVLQERKFMAVDVRNMEPVGDDEATTPTLIINPSHESILRGLVDSHFRRRNLREKHGAFNIDQDIIANKGRGLIILLSGVPGVGKTSTAEKIAHSWKRPLFPITCGNLGTEPVDVEANLKEIFRLAQKWGCILLMDEADVFLSERTPTSLERNALVSIFLRELEYYDGILFLTTNLPGGIDEAFKSRIHISLYYPYLNEETTLAIWRGNLQRLKEFESKRAQAENKKALTIDERGIERFARRHFRRKPGWAGAMERASDPQCLPYCLRAGAPRHFQVVADAILGFEQYLAETRGRTASEMMFQRGQRADFISSPPEQLAHLTSVASGRHNPQSRSDRELLSPPGPNRGQQGWERWPSS